MKRADTPLDYLNSMTTACCRGTANNFLFHSRLTIAEVRVNLKFKLTYHVYAASNFCP